MQHKYFAASNSAQGFVNYYPEIFSRADFVYIIKGGPGTGKSSLMRRLAFEAEGRGDIVEYYYCSSDIDSLDGILIFGKNKIVGFVDGTSPHVREPELAGVKDEIINLSQFWDRSLLLSQKNEIISLSRKKSASYRRAYDYLRTCGNLQTVIDSLLSDVVDEKKIEGAIGRLISSFDFDDGESKVLPLSLMAVAMSGKHRLDSFEQNAKKIFYVGDFYGVGNIILSKILEALKKKSLSIRVSYDAICPWRIDGIFIDKYNYCFVIGESEQENEKQINPKRFVNTNELRFVRVEIRYAKKLYESALEGAIHALGEAKIYHFLLEGIYKNTMDFKSLSEYTAFLSSELK